MNQSADPNMSLGESRDEFIQRVRAALADRGKPVGLPDDLEIARVIDFEHDVVAEFMTRAEQAKSIPHRIPDEAALPDKIMEIIRQVGAATAIVPDDGIPARDEVLARLHEEGISTLDPDDPDAAFSADVGITGAETAIAETASINLTSGNSRRRLASLAVTTHIGVIRADQIVPDLLDWATQQPESPPAGQTLVSGPSKTADIELALVMGVHGPRQEHFIIIG